MANVILKEFTKNFKDVTAVDDLNIEIKDKEFAVLVGPSGCGKTTTLREVAGLEEVTSGQFGCPETRNAELKMIETAVKKGKRPRIEIGPINYSEEKMKEYIDLGVKDFSLPTDIIIVHQWIKANAKVISSLFK